MTFPRTPHSTRRLIDAHLSAGRIVRIFGENVPSKQFEETVQGWIDCRSSTILKTR